MTIMLSCFMENTENMGNVENVGWAMMKEAQRGPDRIGNNQP